ncbi:MAG: PEGA domain-containing protein, partial [Candidatus Eremiobacterota bacterium]
MKYLFIYSKIYMCLFISLFLFSLSNRVLAEGVIVVTTSPSGADIYFAGTYVGNSSATLSGYPPGTYSFSASMSGYETGYTTVVLEKGLDAYGTIYLTALPEPTRPTKKATEPPYKPAEKTEGYVYISSYPAGASVSIDGSYHGTAPTGVTLSKGSHSVTFYLDGYESSSKSVWVEGGGETSVHAELVKSQKAGKLVIKSSPDGAIVYINENKAGKTPYNKEHNPGKYKIKLQKKNYVIFKQEITIEEEKTKQLSIELKPLPGSISIKGTKGASVFLDGKEKGSIPCVIKNISTGTHVLDVKQEGYNSYSSKIKVRAGENISLDIKLTEHIQPAPTEEPSPVKETPAVTAEETPVPPFHGQSSLLLIILLVAIVFFVGTIIVLIKLQQKRKKEKPVQKSEPEILNKQIDQKFFKEKPRQEESPRVTAIREFSFDELLKPEAHFAEDESELDEESYDAGIEKNRAYSRESREEYKKPSKGRDNYRTYEMEQLYERDDEEEDYFEDTEEEELGFSFPDTSENDYPDHMGSDIKKPAREYDERPGFGVRKPAGEYDERPGFGV